MFSEHIKIYAQTLGTVSIALLASDKAYMLSVMFLNEMLYGSSHPARVISHDTRISVNLFFQGQDRDSLKM